SCRRSQVAKYRILEVGTRDVADLRFEPRPDDLKHTALWRLAAGQDGRPLISSLAKTHHSDKGKIYCVPNAAWINHLSEWTLIFRGNHTPLNQRVQGSSPCAPTNEITALFASPSIEQPDHFGEFVPVLVS